MFSRKLKTKIKKRAVKAISAIAIFAGVFVLLSSNETIFKLINSNQEEIQGASISINDVTNETLKNQINSSSKIVGGENNFVALSADGKVYGWGYNNYGQLGLGNAVTQLEPVYMNMSDAIDIASGNSHTLVLKKDGTVWASGLNTSGQLGINSTVTSSNVFVQVKNEDGTGNLENIKAIYAGGLTSYAISNDGKVYGWGYNYYGQLGIANNNSQIKPVDMNITDVKKILGYNQTVALKEDGSVWVAGLNTSGQLGIGNKTNQNTWIEMKDSDNQTALKNVKDIAVGNAHTVILK